MAIRRVTGAVSPSELIFADANALGATYDGSGTTIERGETFTLPAGGTTAVSNGALRLEALKGDCTITNNGNSTLTNASGVNGTILMRSGASDFPAFVRNSSMGFMSTPAREDFTGDVSGTVSGTINSNATFPAGTVLQVVNTADNTEIAYTTGTTPLNYDKLNTEITLKQANSKILVRFDFGSVAYGNGNLGYMKAQFKIGSGSYSDVTPVGANIVAGSIYHHVAVNIFDANYQVDAGSSMTLEHTTSSAEGTVLTYAPWFWAESNTGLLYINRNARNSNGNDFSTVSTCTLMEIAT